MSGASLAATGMSSGAPRVTIIAPRRVPPINPKAVPRIGGPPNVPASVWRTGSKTPPMMYARPAPSEADAGDAGATSRTATTAVTTARLAFPAAGTLSAIVPSGIEECQRRFILVDTRLDHFPNDDRMVARLVGDFADLALDKAERVL